MPRLSKIGAAALAAFGWTSGESAVSASYLQVAGGGGGGGTETNYNGAGGGGAGGYLTGTTSLNLTQSYTVVVGAGGVGGTSTTIGVNGSNSQFGTLTSSVGGGGGGTSAPPTANTAGAHGGSGGGGCGDSPSGISGGAGVSGQGNAGGSGFHGGSYGGGGGGGASAVGQSASATSGNGGGDGGAGTASSITGASVTYAGGGAGGMYSTAGTGNPGTGGAGGGGNGGTRGGGNGFPGTANLGGGGGGATTSSGGTRVGGNGGSGVVIISYAGAQQFGGGVVTTDGTNTIHTFNTSGTLSPISSLSASYLIVAGGGAGGYEGGGGAGGMLTGSGITIDTNSTYLVTVGAGGAGSTSVNTLHANGANSSFSMVSTAAVGGGGGGDYTYTTRDGRSGGSGGGGASLNGLGGSGTSGQGSAGGNGATGGAAGGGGAGAVGANGTTNTGGAGGVGLTSSISGASTYYAGGGGGGGNSTQGAGSLGGGGAGSATGSGVAGTANTGGGGGGVYANGGASGGSGIVIISYAGSVQQMAGGTVTISGGNVIHTFTSSGYLTPLKFVGNSLRFRGSNSATLTRTVTTASSSTKATFSLWAKKGKDFDSNNNGSFVAGADSYYYAQWFQNGLYFGNTTYWMNTAAVYRDYAAWYHIVFVIDTTLATSTDRLQIWVNGVRQTAGGVTSYPPQNASFPFLNTAQLWYIGGRSSDGYLDGYLSEVNFIDGQALTPNSFGTFNSYGVWQPITYGGSYGTNGFYLPFNQGSSTYAGVYSAGTQYLTTATNASLALGTNSFTVEYWLKINTSTGGATAASAGNGTTTYDPLFGYQTGSGIVLYLSSNGSSWDIASNVTVGASTPVGSWNHVAITRSGNTFYTFLNGVQASTFTSSASIYQSANSFTIGRAQNGGSIIANLSNVRVVVGTALYTSNFVPSTAPLTAVTNTQLLTLQNATIVDNSANALAITNTGSITTTQSDIVFANPYSLSKDQGPSGNNWTPNNISNTASTTYDSMTDVPTLTSATAANYCVVNPLDNALGATITNGNLQVTSSSASWKTVRSTFAMPTGSWYVELTSTTGTGNGNSFIGIVPMNVTLPQPVGEGSATSWGYSSNGNIYNNGSIINATGATWSAGTTVAMTFDGSTLKFYRSGTLVATVNSIPSNTYAVGGSFYDNNAGAFNFGQQPFAYTPPSGFVALNTYNL